MRILSLTRFNERCWQVDGSSYYVPHSTPGRHKLLFDSHMQVEVHKDQGDNNMMGKKIWLKIILKLGGFTLLDACLPQLCVARGRKQRRKEKKFSTHINDILSFLLFQLIFLSILNFVAFNFSFSFVKFLFCLSTHTVKSC